MERIKIEHRAYKHNERENHNHAADNLIYYHNAAVIELIPNLVYKPSQAEPPQQRSANNTEITHAHVERMLGDDESELGERRHEQEYDQRIGKSYEKRRNAIMDQRAFFLAAHMYFLSRVGTVTIYAKNHQHHAARYLQYETVLVVVDKIHYETHAEARYQRINKIADRRPDACNETVPPPLVKGTLYAQHTDRPHRRRRDDADKHALEYPIKYV